MTSFFASRSTVDEYAARVDYSGRALLRTLIAEMGAPLHPDEISVMTTALDTCLKPPAAITTRAAFATYRHALQRALAAVPAAHRPTPTQTATHMLGAVACGDAAIAQRLHDHLTRLSVPYHDLEQIAVAILSFLDRNEAIALITHGGAPTALAPSAAPPQPSALAAPPPAPAPNLPQQLTQLAAALQATTAALQAAAIAPPPREAPPSETPAPFAAPTLHGWPTAHTPPAPTPSAHTDQLLTAATSALLAQAPEAPHQTQDCCDM